MRIADIIRRTPSKVISSLDMTFEGALCTGAGIHLPMSLYTTTRNLLPIKQIMPFARQTATGVDMSLTAVYLYYRLGLLICEEVHACR